MTHVAPAQTPGLGGGASRPAPTASTAPTTHDEETIRAFCAALDRLLEERCDPLALDRARAIAPELLDALADAGTFGVSIPEAYGGAGLGLPGACGVVDALARHDRAVATTVGLHLGLGTRPLVAWGTEGQRARWLPPLARGETLAAFAATEPSAGSHLARLATRARIDRAAGRVTVDGQKSYVTNGGLAGVFTVVCGTEGAGAGQGGHSVVVLRGDDPGLTPGPEERKLGLRASSTVPLYLDGVVVDTDRLLGPWGAAHEVLHHALAWGRTVLSAGCTGTAARAVELTLAQVGSRRQFGRALIDLPVVRSQVAGMAARLAAMRALVARAAGDEGEALERSSLVAKVFCSEADWQICDDAMQLHGGSGYIEDTGVAILLRDARITRVFEGTNEVLLQRIGAMEILAPRPAAALSPLAARLGERIDALRARLADAHGTRLLRDHRVLHRLGRVVVWRDAVDALASRAAADPSPRRALVAAHLADLARHATEADLGCERAPELADAVCDELIAGGLR